MGKRQIHLLIDEYLWNQFQALYPRQATKSIEFMLEGMINTKIEITDKQAEQMKIERQHLQDTADSILYQLREHDFKVKAWEAQKRDELIKKKSERRERDIEVQGQIDGINASGMLMKVSNI
jgi:hypothetical protein